MKLAVLLTLGLVALSSAQVPGFTGCPDYQAMDEFDMEKFSGKWYESQRYFQVLEVGSRCVATDYRKLPDGKYVVANELVTRLTGIKRVMEGELKNSGKSGEAKLSVKYSNLPVSFDTQYSILDTDYDNYAIAWSCSSFGPFSSNHAWVMTRKRNPTEAVLQRAYGVLDKFGISRNFFVRSDQTNCDLEENLPVESPAKRPTDSFTASAAEAVAPITAQATPLAAPPPSTANAPSSTPHSHATATKSNSIESIPPIPLVAAGAVASAPAPVADEVPVKAAESSDKFAKN